jgi:adenylosuccinate lyase
MEGILPPEIQWRPGKTSVSSHFSEMLLGKERQLLLQTVERVSPQIEEYVDVRMLRDRCEALLVNSAGVDRNWRAVWPAVTLGAWMAERPHHSMGKQEDAASSHERREVSYQEV